MVGAHSAPVRRWTGIAAALLVGLVVLAAPAVAQAGHGDMDHGTDQPDPDHGDGDHGDPAAGILPPGDWTDEQVEFATDLVRRTETDLQAYADYSTIPSKGFNNFGIDSGNWEHWINPSRMDDAHILDPKFPESLVFRRLPDGTRRLEAAMFHLPLGYKVDAIPEQWAWLPGWHVHPNLCADTQGQFSGFANNGRCERGAVVNQRPMMHVWIVDNDCGHRFAGLDAGLMCTDHHGTPPVLPPITWGPGGTRPPGTTPQPVPPEAPEVLPPAPPATPVKAQPRYTG